MYINMNKEEFLAKETEKLNVIISKALELHHIREGWVANDCNYTDSGKVFPDSVLKFTEIYFECLSKSINKL